MNKTDIKNLIQKQKSNFTLDQEFYVIMNVAVGGTNGFWWSSFYPKAPWKNGWSGRKKAPIDFWNARSKWLPTWKGDETALKIKYVKVWAMEPT